MIGSNAKPYDKDIADLMKWLKEKGLRVSIPKCGPIQFEVDR